MMRMFLGILLGALSLAAAPALSRRPLLGAAVDDNHGVHVRFVRPGSAADRGGLHVDDVVLSVGNDPMQNVTEFLAEIKASPAGVPISFSVKRGAETISLPITLDKVPDETDPVVETLYESVSVDGTLRRTLVTIPRNATGRRPAVLVIGGIGCYSVDNASDPQDAYMRLAHDLSRRGFVVMRLEKSGVGDSYGPPCATVDLLSEMHSYSIALDALRADPHVDGQRVYLFGHSIGTLMAPRIAGKGRTAGVIIADGVGRNWIEYELANLRRQLELGHDSPAAVDAKLAMKEVCMHRLLIDKEREADIERTLPECKTHNDYPASAAYMQQAAAMNIAEPWTTFQLPLLAIYGSADFITTEEDHRRVIGIVNAAHPGTAALKIVDGMDHHFDHAGTTQQAWDVRVVQHGTLPYDEGLSAAAIEWLCQREACLPSS